MMTPVLVGTLATSRRRASGTSQEKPPILLAYLKKYQFSDRQFSR